MLHAAIFSTILAVASAQGYGPLNLTKDMTTGLELLALPEGFSYMSYGKFNRLQGIFFLVPSTLHFFLRSDNTDYPFSYPYFVVNTGWTGQWSK